MKPGTPRPAQSGARIHSAVIHPRINGCFQLSCSCGFLSENFTTYPEAWLAGQVHVRNARRNSDQTREPRWLLNRR